MTLILGIDPGLATGIAVYDTDTLKTHWVVETGKGIKGFRDFWKQPVGPEIGSFEHTASENFTLRSSNKFVADLSGVKINGWLEGEELCATFPEPIQHMTLCRLREKKDNYADSVITKMMKEAGFPIGAGHTRMALSVAVWYAAKVLKHKPTLEMLSGRS